MDTCILHDSTYVWNKCLHGSFLAELILSQQMAHVSSPPPSSSWGTRANLGGHTILDSRGGRVH